MPFICFPASGEDPQCSTPKSRKSDAYNQSHLAPPSASPGAHPQHEDFDMGSPTWPRTPASPVSSCCGKNPLKEPILIITFLSCRYLTVMFRKKHLDLLK